MRHPTVTLAALLALSCAESVSSSNASDVAVAPTDAVAADAPALVDAPASPPRAVAISASSLTTCAVMDDGTLRCWGSNGSAQLGLGTEGGTRTTPTTVPGLASLAGVVVGDLRTCAWTTDGAAWCWGLRLLEAESPRVRTDPSRVEEIGPVRQIDLGSAHLCLLLRDGSVRCRGHNGYGQLGDGTVASRATFAPVRDLRAVTAITLGGGNSTCALPTDGVARCWGRNSEGQIGDDMTAERCVVVVDHPCRRAPTALLLRSAALQVVSAGGRACARFESGDVTCWGTGVTDTGRPSAPVSIPGTSDATQIALGGIHACVLLRDTTVRCWGHNENGQLGDGTTADRAVPVAVAGLRDVVQVAVGHRRSCALRRDGAVLCWGDNAIGQLGDGTTTERHVPTLVPWRP